MSVIEICGLRKRYGSRDVVCDRTFDVPAGTITGFLGRNGAGKSTALRVLLGLARPTAGTALVCGRPYTALDDAARRVGAVLETGGFHPGRTARAHLAILTAAAGLSGRRVTDVLDQVGLTAAADRRVGGYSLGMRQRLALAAALLGRPEVLILDEPTNGLDPVGVRELRDLLRGHAASGGTVLVSSHQLAEVAQVIDQVVIIHEGRLVTSGPATDLLGRTSSVRVRTPDADRLHRALAQAGAGVDRLGADVMVVRGCAPEQIGALALRTGAVLVEMAVTTTSLEDAFLALTESPGAARGAATLEVPA